MQEVLKIIFTGVFVLFLPGFAISWAFFDKGQIDTLERIALSVALSLASVPLVAFYANLAGIKITPDSVIGETLFIIAAAGVAYLVRTRQKRK